MAVLLEGVSSFSATATAATAKSSPAAVEDYSYDWPVQHSSTTTSLAFAFRSHSVNPGTLRGKPVPSLPAFGAETGAGASISDTLEPGGNLIGKAGTDASIRELSGGLPEAQSMFEQLRQGGTVVEQTPYLTRVELPNGGFVQLRTVMSNSPNTAATVDLNIPGVDITKLKFNP